MKSTLIKMMSECHIVYIDLHNSDTERIALQNSHNAHKGEETPRRPPAQAIKGREGDV